MPLSLPQRELWENSPLAPGDPANHICATVGIRGSIAFDLCAEALRMVVERQEVLRTSILSGGGTAAQFVQNKAETILSRRDAGTEEEAGMAAFFSKPFDMVRGPLYRVELIRLAADHYILALAFHHAIADGWSLGIFVGDFTAAYIVALKQSGRAFLPVQGLKESLTVPDLSYSRWSASENARWQPKEVAREAGYWRSRLAGARLMFQTSRAEAQPLQHRATSLPPPLLDAARLLAKQAEVTVFSVLLTAFQVAIFRWRGVLDVVLGVPHANRSNPQARDTMGYFAGVVPLRVSLVPEHCFEATLKANHSAQIEDFSRAMPFAELARALGPAEGRLRHQIFDVRFALQNHPVPSFELPRISTRLKTISTGTARFDLACELTEERGALDVVWLYRQPAVSGDAIGILDSHLKAVLEEAGQNSRFQPGRGSQTELVAS